MEALSRRKFVTTASVGLAAAGALGAARPLTGSGTASPAEPHVDAIPDAVVAHVDDLATGVVRLFTGEKSVTITDHALAQHLARAAGH